MAKQITELDKDTKEKLARAYMSLYDALVAKYQSQHMTLGASWYNALIEIYKILEKQKTTNSNQALNYLMNFYNSHRQTQTKKMMTDAKKDSVIDFKESSARKALDKAETEKQVLQEMVSSFAETEVYINKKNKTSSKGFFDWLDLQPENQGVDLENDPRSFERAYRKFFLQQKRRSK